MAHKNKPEIISLTQEQIEALKLRIADSSLSLQDQKIMIALLSFNLWLQNQLSRAKLNILRLKKIFGLPTEKKSAKQQETLVTTMDAEEKLTQVDTDAQESEEKTSEQPVTTTPPKPKPIFDPDQNHGRIAASDYVGCPHMKIPHATLKPGDLCPLCAEGSLNGKLYALDPKVIVILQGNAMITGTRYLVEKLRCALCGEQYEATLPEEIKQQSKYSGSCRSAIAMSRYYAGVPFKRLEYLQALQGVPLADATQWDQIKILYQIILPVYRVLETKAAQGQLIYYDDTGNRILELYGSSKAVHTTAFISMLGPHAIYLFYTAQHYAGENMASLLSKRTSEERLITMSDASSQNLPKAVDDHLAARWILCFCLVHGRRKFYELFESFKEECQLVLDIIGQVYKHEAYCKKQKMDQEKRLLYHQEQSTTLMESLRIWLNNQLLYQLVEENSGLGQAVRYMLRHWEALTTFLHVPGAPIDNSLCEQAIKVAIRHRRNSLSYKTANGASIGDCIMSMIHTAAKNKVNPFAYLTMLQRHAAEVHATPENWLPWSDRIMLEVNLVS